MTQLRAITASEWNRVAACPASAALPAILGSTSRPAQAGTARHQYLRDVPRLGRDAALALVPEQHREMCGAIELDGLPLDAAHCRYEAAMVLNLQTGEARDLGDDVDRQYGELGPYDAPGTADVMSRERSRRLAGAGYVADYKSLYDAVTPPVGQDLQLGHNACCAAALLGYSCVMAEKFYLNSDGTWHNESITWDMFALAAIRLRLLAAHTRAAAARALYLAGTMPDVVAGPHCGYCPARKSCPDKLALLQEVVLQPERFATRARLLTEQERGAAYLLGREAEAMVKSYRQEVRDSAAADPIALPDGRLYGMTRGGTVREYRAGQEVEP